jgi:hypothetical protein
MIHIGGKADQNDINHMEDMYGAIDMVLPCPVKNGDIHPNTTRFLTKDGQVHSMVHVKPVYYKHVNGQWRPLSEVTVHHGNTKIHLNERWTDIHPAFLNWLIQRQEQFPKGELLIPSPVRLHDSPIRLTRDTILFTSSEFFPLPGTTVDGSVRYDPNSSWSTVRDSATGTGATYTDASSIIVYTEKSGANYQNWRGIVLFGTSSIASGDTITSAVISAKFGTGGGAVGLCLTQSSPTSNTALATGDYDQTRDSLNGATEGMTRVNFDTFSGTGYQNITLGATGLTWIIKGAGGISKFGFASAWDLDNTTPSSGVGLGGFVFSDTAGTTSDPKLIVQHTAGGGGATTSSRKHTLLMLGAG